MENSNGVSTVNRASQFLVQETMSQDAYDSDESDPLVAKVEDGWEDLEPDYEPQTVVCLFNDETFHDVKSMLEHCRESFNFDFIKTRKELGV